MEMNETTVVESVKEEESSFANVVRILKIVNGGIETLLGIPVLGGAIVIGLLWTPLFLMMVLHIVTLVFAIKANKSKAAPILGIVSSAIAWIPFVGMIMHILTAIFNLIEGIKNK